jgi:hypothetical protein
MDELTDADYLVVHRFGAMRIVDTQYKPALTAEPCVTSGVPRGALG